MKKITATKLKNILASHKLWVETKGKEGVCANLSDADLEGANLRDANLTDADLGGAYLRGANLNDAKLTVADLKGANLQGANLQGADLKGANLQGAYLEGANLTGTILEKKAEKQPEVVSVKAESTIRSEFEALAKKHGMKIESMTFSLI